MLRHNPRYYRSISTLFSPGDALLADKAIVYLRRHPEQLTLLSSHFTPQASFNLLLKSQFDQHLFLKFLNWARSQQFFSFQCKCLALHILTRFKLYKAAQSLAEEVVVNTVDETGQDLFQCLKNSYHQCKSSSAVFDLVVKSCARVNLINKALNIVNLAKSHGFMPGVLSYNAVLDAVIRTKQSVKMAEGVFKEMIESGVSPNVYTYNILIRGFCTAGNLEMGLSFFGEMERNGCLPNVVTYNTIIDAYCKLRKIDEAFKLFRSMALKGLDPNLISYNVVINGLCREGQMKETSEILEEMSQRRYVPDQMVKNGLSPNVVTYTTLINSMCKAGNLNRAMEILDQMRGRGLHPNGRTYTTLIDGFSQQGLLKQAYQVMKEMVENGFTPTIITYNALINGHCILGRMEDASGLLQEMVERGFMPDVVSYSTIISGFCRNQELEKAFQLKVEMVAKGISPDVVTYSSLIQGLCKQRRLGEVCDLFQEMLSLGLPPDEVTYTSLINAYCIEGGLDKALRLHDEMIQKGFSPDIVTYNVLINGLNKQARTKEAKRLLLKLLYEESVPNEITYNTLIENCNNLDFKSALALMKGFCMKGLMNEADRVFESMLRKGYKLNEELYNVIIHGHSKVGNIEKAYNLYKEMLHSGFVPHSETIMALAKSLYSEGKDVELNQLLDYTLKSCRITEGALAKVLVGINSKEGNMDAVFNVLKDMALSGLLPYSSAYLRT
ncbi:hypothetical protein IC582_000042 [Cucumis melo]